MSIQHTLSNIFWVIILSVCMVIGLIYLVLQMSLFDKTKVLSQLEKNDFYSSLKQERITPLITRSSITERSQGLLTDDDLSKAIDQVFDDATIRQIGSQNLEATYRWLNRQTPELSLRTDVSPQTDEIVAVLTKTATERAKMLPACTAADLTTAQDELRCLPPGTTPQQLSDVVSQQLSQAFFNAGDAIELTSEATLPLGTSSIQRIPEIYGYFWLASLIAGLFGSVALLYLLISRRLKALTVTGASLAITGIVGLVGWFALSYVRYPRWHGQTFDTLLTSSRELVRSTLFQLGTIALITGVLLFVVGLLITRGQKKTSL